MAEGGTVVADGGRSQAPTADSVPVKLSHGEAVLPVKTVAALGGPAAVEHLIETTNGKPTATRGLRAGGHYAGGNPGWWDKTKSAFDAAKNAFATAAPAAQPAPAPEAPAATQPRVDGRGAPFEVNGPLTADGRAAELKARAMANTNVRPNTTVVGQLAEGVKDVSQTVGKGLSKVTAVANNPLVRNAGYTGVALSAVEPVVEAVQNKNQIRLDHPELGQPGALASRANEILANTVDLGLKGVDNLSDMTRLPMNWAVEKLGGPKNYFRGRALSNALHSAYGAEPTAGTGPVVAEAPAAPAKPAEPTVPYGDAPMAMDRVDAAVATAAAQGQPAAQAPSNDIQRRTIRTPDGRTQTEFYGEDVKQTYTGADGKPTNNWYDTQDYKDSQVRAAKDKELLKTYEKWGFEGDLKSNNEFYQRRGLARQKAFDENNRADAAREVAAANRDIQQQELGIRREDLGLRREQEARALAGAQLDREQKILETQRKATEDMDKDEEQAFKAYSPMFTRRGKDGQGNDVDLEDKDAHAAFINAVRHTMAQRGVVHPVNGRPISFGSLNKAEQDRLFNRYNAVQRLKGTMGNFPWNADKVDSLNLDDFDAVQNKDGTLSFPKLEARMKGRSIRARQKDFEYTEPSKWYDPFQTPDNTLLMNLLSKRG